MSVRFLRPVVNGVALGFLTAAFAGAQTNDRLVDAPNVELIRENCLDCHDESTIVASSLDREGWEGVLDLMLGMGMPPLEGETRELVLDYLVETQGPAEGDSGAADLPWARPNPMYRRVR